MRLCFDLSWTCALTPHHVRAWHVGAARGLVLKRVAKSRDVKESRSQILGEFGQSIHQTGFPYYSHASQGSLPAFEFRRHSWAIPSSKHSNFKWIKRGTGVMKQKNAKHWILRDFIPSYIWFLDALGIFGSYLQYRFFACTTILERHSSYILHLRSVSRLIAPHLYSLWMHLFNH